MSLILILTIFFKTEIKKRADLDLQKGRQGKLKFICIIFYEFKTIFAKLTEKNYTFLPFDYLSHKQFIITAENDLIFVLIKC